MSSYVAVCLRPGLISTSQFISIEFTRSLPFWVISLSRRFKLFSVQLVCVSALAKCLTALSVMLLPARSKLFSLQLVCVSAVAK